MHKLVKCPKCATDATPPDNVMEGEVVQCTEWELEMEIVSLSPLNLELAPEEEENWGE